MPAATQSATPSSSTGTFCRPHGSSRSARHLGRTRLAKSKASVLSLDGAESQGATYRIVMEIEPQCDVEKLSAVIQSHIPHATLEKYTEAELSFILPKEYIERFEALFNDLKEKKSELGIASFDASITTMEEVFHK
ncbi:hypothetical protein QTO34_013136 [Cnephaeus nilssonii]|uniref:Uncharacterized protein n=1 Tax=Cnephaeus nilssonii TaxID=3371016 RepID=A0AA40I8N2_CNENI|nr:hypothetical protein QTO34_013136 [Eptesicus nilssonii]